MKRIKNVLELFKLDWNRILHNKITIILILALMILPSLYAWFNIAALWDPYSNTGDIAIAVYSADKTVDIMGHKINVGDKLIKNLKKNHKIGWRFVKSKEELDEGVKSGKYYAGIYLPSNFSKNLTSFLNGDITKPKIEYSVNQKINAIAPKIADKGASTIQTTISNEFVQVVSDTLLKIFNDIGFNLDKNLVSINKISSRILYADENMDTIEKYLNQVTELNAKMPEFKDKLNQANNFIEYLPEVNNMADKLVKVNAMVPEIEKAGNIILDVQKRIPEIQDAGRQIAMIDNDFDSITGILDDTIQEAKDAIGIIQDAQQVLPEVKEVTEQVNNTLPNVRRDLKQVQNALPNVATGVRSGMKVVAIVSAENQKLTNALVGFIDTGDKEQNKAIIVESLNNISSKLKSNSDAVGALSGLLKSLNNLNPNGSQRLSRIINKLNNIQSIINGVKADVDYLSANINALSPEEIKAKILSINAAVQDINNKIQSIDVAGIENEVNNLLQSAISILETSEDITNKVIDTNLIDRINILMNNTVGIINKTVDIMEKYQGEMPKIKNEIHSANMLINNNMDTIINAINTSASIYRDDFPTVKEKLKKASAFVQNDLPEVEQELNKTLKMANEKFPEVEKAVSMADSMIKSDWPQIKKGINKAADAIRKGEKDVDLTELIKILKRDAKAESDFIASPVDLVQNDIYPIPNYGSASAPFYTALCLWVGAVLLSSMASTEFYLTDEQKKKYSRRQQFLARYLSFLLIGFFQALIVSIGNLALLHIYCANPVAHIIFSLFVGFVFMTMVYILVALMGNLGKGAAVIILVLSISGGGGNFPIEMSGPFFRMINPFLPFTYAVNLIRESVGGLYAPSVAKSAIMLSIFAAAFFFVGVVLYPPVKGFFLKLNAELKEGHFLH